MQQQKPCNLRGILIVNLIIQHGLHEYPDDWNLFLQMSVTSKSTKVYTKNPNTYLRKIKEIMGDKYITFESNGDLNVWYNKGGKHSDLPNGCCTIWYKSKKLKGIQQYKNGIRLGRTFFYESGEPMEITSYWKNGHVHQSRSFSRNGDYEICVTYAESGSKESLTEYKAGIKNGNSNKYAWSCFQRDVVAVEEHHKDDVLHGEHKETFFDEDDL